MRTSSRRAPLFLALAALGLPAARAAEPPLPPATVQLSAVALPVIANQSLVNFVFVTIRLELAPGAEGAAVRAKEAYFRDALVRAAYRTPFTRTDSYNRLNDDAISAELLRDAARLVGPGIVRKVMVIKEVPQQDVRAPGPSAGGRPHEIIP